MSTSSAIWRPSQRIRPIAIGIVRRNDEFLLMAARNDSSEIKGWRPPGGAIEFGEHADRALKREFLEEIGEDIHCLKQICVLENLYIHEGAHGHEIVFVIEAAFNNSTAYSMERFEFVDGGARNELSWIKVGALVDGGQTLFPGELLQNLA